MVYNTIQGAFALQHIFRNSLKVGGCLSRMTARNTFSESAAYDGDGKTTVKVLSQEETHLNLISTYSDKGFRLINHLFITGSLIVFPTQIFSWNVKRGVDINMESLILFDLLVPKTKIIIIGYGQQGEPYDPSIVAQLKKKGISCELLPTQHAVTTYNFLVHDAVHVAGAFVPVKDQVDMTRRDLVEEIQLDELSSDTGYFPGEIAERRETIEKLHKNIEDSKKKFKGQTTFDD